MYTMNCKKKKSQMMVIGAVYVGGSFKTHTLDLGTNIQNQL